uniref:Scaffolding anchor of CK1 domain-containing protein n=1 Tax=Gopherus agassizii TaxID=38772 RepID=A0A452GV23_9SAUR
MYCLCHLCSHTELCFSLLQVPSQWSYPAGSRFPREYYRLALDVLAEEGQESYHRFLDEEGAPDFLCNTEVEHITQHLQKPQYANQESSCMDAIHGSDIDGSSGTYWPMNSDLAVPELDLGWPMVFGFKGTEVTTLVQPPPPDNPSIKEEARRMIRAAQQVVAIVMDVFTDVDLLSEVLDAAARRVPVYILLDEMNSQLFLDTAAKCKSLPHLSAGLQFLRVRTVAGPTYYCRTGMSFKGHVKEKFLLVDCMVVLSGNYSSILAHNALLFQGIICNSVAKKTTESKTKLVSYPGHKISVQRLVTFTTKITADTSIAREIKFKYHLAEATTYQPGLSHVSDCVLRKHSQVFKILFYFSTASNQSVVIE